MIKVLFVCHGNICRSPMAEFVFKNIVANNNCNNSFEVASAATSTEEIGSDIHYGTKQVLREHRIPFERRQARQMTKKDYEYYDYIVCMDSLNVTNIKRITDGKLDKVCRLMEFVGEDKDVADPWYTHNFEITYDDINRGCTAMFDKLENRKYHF